MTEGDVAISKQINDYDNASTIAAAIFTLNNIIKSYLPHVNEFQKTFLITILNYYQNIYGQFNHSGRRTTTLNFVGFTTQSPIFSC